MPLSSRNRSNLPFVIRFAVITPSACDLPSRRRCDIGTVNSAATTLNIASNVTWSGEEPLLQRRQRRYFVWIQRPHQLRRNQHEQLRLLRTIRLGPEQMTDDWET